MSLFEQPVGDNNAIGNDTDQPLTISEVTLQIKDLLEGSFQSVCVTGEVSNLSQPQSGHCYLTLKDDQAQLRAVIWRGTAQKLTFDLHDGLEVVCHGGVDVYAPRGSYQLVIRRLQPKGVGALEQALRRLQQKLAAEGLFDPAHKKLLPRFPKTVAVVTSPTGAAIHDFLQVLRRRTRGIRIVLAPVRVQGEGSANEIADAIRRLNQLDLPVDVVVVGRGGGSLEDLWAFNEEPVVRAIFDSRIPVISAVGHEVDVTLADLVADVRALTPSEAAERVAPEDSEIRTSIVTLQRRMAAVLRGRAIAARSQLDAIAAHRVFRRPLDVVHDRQRQLDDLAARANRSVRRTVTRFHDRTDAVAAQLESLSPLAVLSRGYSVTFRKDDGQPIRDASRLEAGDAIVTRYESGASVSSVEQIELSDDNKK